jgi:hypothetical protein
MKHLLLLACLLAALPALAHPGHDAPPGHAWFEHAELPLAAIGLIVAVLAWGMLRRRQGVLPLALAIALALGFGTAGVGLPL